MPQWRSQLTKIFVPVMGDISPQEDLKLKCDSQSLAFYSDIASFMSKNIPGYGFMSLLDVGARTAAGAALLRAIFHPRSFARLKLHPVTALDIDAAAIAAARTEYLDLEYITDNVANYKGKRSWDIVLSSHTIEHVPDPEGFLAALEAVAGKYLIVACPISEEKPFEPGHIHSFDFQFFEKHGFSHFEAYRSLHWHKCLAGIAMKRIGP
jgi:ubiquinone/menaquinone biosynthesis C-methylase UbiE